MLDVSAASDHAIGTERLHARPPAPSRSRPKVS